MADVVVIRVFNQRRRWVVQLDGREDLRFNARGRGRAVEAALDLAETVAPALVVVHTADWYREGDPVGFLMAVLGSIILLALYRMLARRSV